MKLLASIAIVFSLAVGIMTPMTVAAQEIGLEYAAQSGLKATDPRVVVARLINIFLTLLGVITVIVILYSGFLMLTSGGNSEQMDKAKRIITAAVIGLIIIMTAWAITNYVLRNLYKVTTGNTYKDPADALYPGTL